MGALAVALGVGTAVATGQGFGLGVARADDSGAADGPAGTETTPQANEPPAPVGQQEDPVGDDEGEADPGEDNPYVPEMNYSGGVDTDDDESPTEAEPGDDTVEPTEDQTPPAPPTGEVTPPSAAPSQPQDRLALKHTEDQDNSIPPPPPPPAAPDTDVVDAVVDDEDLTAPPDSEAPVYARMTVMLDEEPGAHTMLLSSDATQDSALTSLADADAVQAGPVEALLSIPNAIVSVANTVVAALLSPFLAPGPAAPAQPPLLFALLGWVQREIQRALFNRTPDAVVDTVTTSEDTGKVIDVLGNDTDFEGDPITVTSYTQPAHGTVVQNADGTLTYTPTANYNGPDSFTYTVRDQGFNIVGDVVRLLTGAGPRTDTATVNITVTAVNDAPTAAVTLANGQAATTSDPQINFTVTFSEPVTGFGADDVDTSASTAGGTLVKVVSSGPTVYTVTVTGMTTTGDVVISVPAGAATDAAGNLSTATATATVRYFGTPPINNLPNAVDDTYTTTAGTPINLPAPGLLANDTDLDGDQLFITSVSQPANGTLIFNPNGSISYLPRETFTGTDTFTYRIVDGHTGDDTATVTIHVIAANQPPGAENDTYSVLTGGSLVVPAETGVLFNDVDAEDEPLTAQLASGPSGGELTLNADGSFTYTPGAGFTGVDSFTYRAVAGTVASAVATVTISVGEIAVTGRVELGGETAAVAVSTDGRYAYIIDSADNELVVVNLGTTGGAAAITRAMAFAGDFGLAAAAETPVVEARIPLPTSLGYSGIAVDPGGTYLYIAQRELNTVSVINLSTNSVERTIAVGRLPERVEIAGNRLFVLDVDNTISVIDTTTWSLVDTAPAQAGVNPINVAGPPGFNAADILATGIRMYVVGQEGTVKVFETIFYTQIASFSTPGGFSILGQGLAISEDGTRLYVLNEGTLTAFDTSTYGIVGVVDVPDEPIDAVFQGSRAYVLTNRQVVTPDSFLINESSVQVIDTTTMTLVATVALGFTASGIAISPNGEQILVAGKQYVVPNSFSDGFVVVLTNAHDNNQPVVGTPPFDIVNVNTATGVVDGALNVRDPNGDNLSYTVTEPPAAAIGSVSIVNVAGDWTFTPTQGAREAANASPGEDTVQFTISITDGGSAPVEITVTVPIDPTDTEVTDVIALDHPPAGVAITPDGTRAYVVVPDPQGDSRIVVVDTTSGEILDIDIPVGFSPFDIAISPDGTLAYVTQSGGTAVTAIDLTTDTVIDVDPDTDEIDTIQVEFGAYRVIFSPDGAHAYVSSTSGALSVIDTTTHTVTETITITNTAGSLAIRGNYLYVGNHHGANIAQLTVIDLSDGDIEAIVLGSEHVHPQTMAVVGNHGYVPLPGGVVWVVDLNANEVIDINPVLSGVNPIAVGTESFPVGIATNGSRVYIADAVTNSVIVIDTITRTVAEIVPLDVTPRGIAVSPDGSTIYVTAGDFTDPENPTGAVIVIHDTSVITI